ncbi:ACCELERATED CELL DEATH 6 [Olea europaea subsp. europaea]|uniref:ACCELERATED CELL DEATH 6 n=1 Tax=Olea europaea subsp. europaea TaxID=158383 RepID=A0A8S0SS56_OLEEU|nr:ACCELERATED CELL DEATH 6 [Olea europaea subsp. europaea]
MSVPKYPGLSEEVEESYETADTMDPKLYRATTGGDILEFVRAMEHVTVDRHHDPPATCVQLGPQKTTVLHIATSFGHHEIVKLICKDLTFLVADKNARGDTALHIAARAGDLLMVQILIHSEYKEGGLGEKNEKGNTALHEALIFSHEEVARILIEKNLNMEYSHNKAGKSLLYLAAEAGFVTIAKLLLENPVGNYNVGGKTENKSPVFAAILGRNIDVLNLLWERYQSSFQSRSGNGKNPLHVAVCTEYKDGVNFLLSKHHYLAYQKDKRGFFPIHSASQKGFIDIIKLILQNRPDTRELLATRGQNILHIAARSGNYKIVDFMLKMPELEKLINEKDADGNTPLHLATICGYPKLVHTLIRDERVIIELVNNNYQTVLDIAAEHIEPEMASFQKLTWMALRVIRAPQARQTKNFSGISFRVGNQTEKERWNDKINVILLMATVVATVTFTAGFTIPGGYNNTNPEQGIATMLEKVKFQEFVICDILAMYSSIIVAVILLWTQLGDTNSKHVALKLAVPLLGIALAMMSIAFMAGVYLVVSKLSWLANVVLFMGTIYVIALAVLLIPLCFIGLSNCRVYYYIYYYPLVLVLYIVGT